MEDATAIINGESEHLNSKRESDELNSKNLQLLLTSKDCQEIVEKDLGHTDFKIKSHKIVQCSAELVGFMGEYYKLQVEIEENLSNTVHFLSYFIKALPIRNAIYRDECERKGFFFKESSIYAKILPNIQRYADTPLWPKSYLSRRDLIVMEDFSLPKQNLRQMKENESYTQRHYEIYMQHLAKLHAASLAWQQKEGVDIYGQYKDILFELQLNLSNEWYLTGVKGVIYLAERHPHYQYPEAQEFIRHKLMPIFLNMEETTNPSKTLPNVLCHRDSWDRNIFWEYQNEADASSEPIACRIVDFQLMRYCPPAVDCLHFLYYNIKDVQQRDKEIPIYLQYYYEALQKELKRLELPEELITRSDFSQDCRQALLPVLTLVAICTPLLSLPKGWAYQMRANEPKTFDGYLNHERSPMFERVATIFPEYTEIIQRPVQELMEYFGFEAK